MSEKTYRIEVTFPTGIDLTQDDQQSLIDLVDGICKRYEATHPERAMWPAGIGQKLLSWDDDQIEFDESTFVIDVAERENYDWPCAKCGKSQGDHEHCIIDPAAGDCEYEPGARA